MGSPASRGGRALAFTITAGKARKQNQRTDVVSFFFVLSSQGSCFRSSLDYGPEFRGSRIREASAKTGLHKFPCSTELESKVLKRGLYRGNIVENIKRDTRSLYKHGSTGVAMRFVFKDRAAVEQTLVPEQVLFCTSSLLVKSSNVPNRPYDL